MNSKVVIIALERLERSTRRDSELMWVAENEKRGRATTYQS